ncbi:MAG: ClpXP protease specificity-enhancing factor [Betaproteobacteria bacterium]|nr:ClpXP protease specificity-enhancing factor [Betaproteobacteria bacterium]
MAQIASTKPYLLRAIREWCVDQGYTPYLAVIADGRTRLPREHVNEGQIVLNLGPEATHQLVMGNEFITFSARFNGVAQALSIPIDSVSAIYARENGQGMAFEVAPQEVDAPKPAPEPAIEEDPARPASPPGRPHLTRIK